MCGYMRRKGGDYTFKHCLSFIPSPVALNSSLFAKWINPILTFSQPSHNTYISNNSLDDFSFSSTNTHTAAAARTLIHTHEGVRF